ncbi:MAG: CDP-glycerol glycerophosphotransferase family protein [Clostridiales bacterium]|nr:CDP-glycerol glycerophosphotransferase family protein [Clostridiales bacterium]
MEVKRTLIRNIICAILCILLACGLGYLLYTNHQEQQAETAAIEAAVEEAKPYEQEMEELEAELEALENAVSYTSDAGDLMVGFLCSDTADLNYIAEKAETYQFPPVLVLDCTMEQTELEQLLGAVEDEWEIVLYAPAFSEDVNDAVMSVFSYLRSIERKQTGVFLLRSDYSSESNIQLLLEDGFVGYTSYHSKAPEAGQTADGAVYFDYSYLSSSGTTVEDRLAALYNNKSAMLVVFETDSIGSDALPETYVTSLLDTMQAYTEQDDCAFSTVEKVVEELSGINALESDNQAAYEEQAAVLQQKIEQLEETIDEIYASLGE